MMKRILFSSSLVLLALAGAVWLGATHADVSAPVAETVNEVAPASAPSSGDACQQADPLFGETELACCIDQCRRDKDCRAVCGFEFGGQCVLVNSCCRECFCFGFAPTGTPS